MNPSPQSTNHRLIPSNDVIERVRGAALRRARSFPLGAEVDDVAQETVARFLELPDVASIRVPEAWATRVAGNLAISLLRRNAVVDCHDSHVGVAQLLLISALSTSDVAIAREQAARLVRLMSQREFELIARSMAGETHQEIAQAMGYASADSVKATLWAMRRRIRAAATAAGIDEQRSRVA